MRAIVAQRQATQRRVEIGRQHRCLAHRIDPALARAGQAGAIADGEDVRMGKALQGRRDPHETVCIAAQTTLRQPGHGLRAAGEEQALAAPDRRLPADQAVFVDAADRAILAHPHAAPAQMAERAQAQTGGMPAEQRPATEQRQLRHLIGQGQGQLDPGRTTAENRHGLRIRLPALPAGEKLGEGLDRQHLHASPRLWRTGNLAADIQRQPIGIQPPAIGQMHLLLHGRQCLGLADNQLDLGRPAQRRQLDLAIRRGVAAGQQARQHPGIPRLVPGTEQGNAPRRSLEPCPATQYAKVGMAGTDQ
ncbi:hypothetical protein D3C80_1307260 [compost metagenome]